MIEMLYTKHSWFPQNSSIGNIKAFKKSYEKEHINQYGKLFNLEKPLKIESIIIFDYFKKLLLSDYLRKVDMMSMLNGVEWRLPMLDEDLSTFAFSIPFNQKSNFRTTKMHLRAIHKKIYNGINSDRGKKGFSIPLDKYLSIDDKNEMGNEILKKNTIVEHYFKKEYLEILVKQFQIKRESQTFSRESIYQRILMLYNLKKWYEKK